MDNVLNNTAMSVGNYNEISTSLTSDVSVVNLVNGLSITKTADKQSWANGPLTYTITISNQAEESYVSPVVTDIIDSTLVDFVDGSVTINGTPATSTEYSYNNETSTLTVNLQSIIATGQSVITFRVTKKI